jgi:hypothetical protein
MVFNDATQLILNPTPREVDDSGILAIPGFVREELRAVEPSYGSPAADKLVNHW